VGLNFEAVSGPSGRVVRTWSAACDGRTRFNSIAKVNPMIAFARIGGITTVHLRGPETQATPATCPSGAEFFGAELRIGAYLPMFPPARIANLRDGLLPTLSDGRILIDNRAWEMPTPQNLDVFVDRLERAGLLVFDPLVEELRHVDTVRNVPERTAQSRFVRAVGLSRRKLQVIERAHRAAGLLRAGGSIPDVVRDAGYYDQPHLTRALRRLIGQTPAEVARGAQFLAL
jgi:AraC-like DNA-binding protein